MKGNPICLVYFQDLLANFFIKIKGYAKGILSELKAL